jgi:hypothetical protein
LMGLAKQPHPERERKRAVEGRTISIQPSRRLLQSFSTAGEGFCSALANRMLKPQG